MAEGWIGMDFYFFLGAVQKLAEDLGFGYDDSVHGCVCRASSRRKT